MATDAPTFYDWETGDGVVSRLVDFGDMVGIDYLQSDGSVRRSIEVPGAGRAESVIPGGANIPAGAKTKKLAELPTAKVMPAPGGGPTKTPELPRHMPAPSANNPFILKEPPVSGSSVLEELVPKPTVGADGPGVQKDEAPLEPVDLSKLGEPSVTQSHHKYGLPRINARARSILGTPTNWNPLDPTTPVSALTEGASTLYERQQAGGRSRGYRVKGSFRERIVTGKNPSELATNWVKAMKEFRHEKDTKALKSMSDLFDF